MTLQNDNQTEMQMNICRSSIPCRRFVPSGKKGDGLKIGRNRMFSGLSNLFRLRPHRSVKKPEMIFVVSNALPDIISRTNIFNNIYQNIRYTGGSVINGAVNKTVNNVSNPIFSANYKRVYGNTLIKESKKETLLLHDRKIIYTREFSQNVAERERLNHIFHRITSTVNNEKKSGNDFAAHRRTLESGLEIVSKSTWERRINERVDRLYKREYLSEPRRLFRTIVDLIHTKKHDARFIDKKEMILARQLQGNINIPASIEHSVYHLIRNGKKDHAVLSRSVNDGITAQKDMQQKITGEKKQTGMIHYRTDTNSRRAILKNAVSRMNLFHYQIFNKEQTRQTIQVLQNKGRTNSSVDVMKVNRSIEIIDTDGIFHRNGTLKNKMSLNRGLNKITIKHLQPATTLNSTDSIVSKHNEVKNARHTTVSMFNDIASKFGSVISNVSLWNAEKKELLYEKDLISNLRKGNHRKNIQKEFIQPANTQKTSHDYKEDSSFEFVHVVREKTEIQQAVEHIAIPGGIQKRTSIIQMRKPRGIAEQTNVANETYPYVNDLANRVFSIIEDKYRMEAKRKGYL